MRELGRIDWSSWNSPAGHCNKKVPGHLCDNQQRPTAARLVKTTWQHIMSSAGWNERCADLVPACALRVSLSVPLVFRDISLWQIWVSDPVQFHDTLLRHKPHRCKFQAIYWCTQLKTRVDFLNSDMLLDAVISCWHFSARNVMKAIRVRVKCVPWASVRQDAFISSSWLHPLSGFASDLLSQTAVLCGCSMTIITTSCCLM